MRTIRPFILGGVALAVCSMAAFAAPPDSVSSGQKSVERALIQSIDGSAPAELPVEQERPFGTRNLTQFPGVTSGCQLWGTVERITSPGYRRADNFKPAANSTITQVKWSGLYRQMTSAANGTQPAGESFEIRFYTDNLGFPGTPVGAGQVVTPTATTDGTLGTPAATVYNYQATLPTGVAVVGGDCYWMEIVNLNTAGQRWVWRSGLGADSYHFGWGVGNPLAGDQVAGDLSFCLDIELLGLVANPCPKATIPAACANPDVNGQPRVSANNGYSSNLPGSVGLPGLTSVAFERAESFRLSSSGNITSVCFYAFFNSFGSLGGANVGGGFPANPDIKVTYYQNDIATGLPGAEIVSYTVGDPGVTIVRDASATNTNHKITHPAVPVLANTCYHISLSYRSDVNDPTRHCIFLWGSSFSTAANTDLVIATRNNNPTGAWGFTANTGSIRGVSFLFDVGPAVLPACSPPTLTNVSCATATPITIGGAAVNGYNFGQPSTVLAPCGFELLYGGVVWYSMVGDGTTVTVSTCNASLFGDPVMSIWCAPNGCGQELNCIQSNDDVACAAGALAAENTFATVAGQTYYISMSAAGGGGTAFAIQATSNGVPANPPAAACGTFQRCELSAAPSDVQEVEPCLDSTNVAQNTNGVCAGASVYPSFGTIVAGHNSTFLNGAANTRDFDLWVLPAVAEPTVVTWKINSEFPCFYTFLNFAVDCTSVSTNVFGPVTRLACQDAFISETTLPNTGINVLRISVPDFQGLPCPNYNDYRFVVTPVQLGSCCVVGINCQQTGAGGCATQGGIFTAGAACSPVDTCNGVCCTGAACAVATINECTGAGTTYIAGGTCSPDPCAAPTGVCCRGATCSTTVTTSAACTSSLIGGQAAGAAFPTGAACNAGNVSNSPCCYANYNKTGGVTVNDIFDFLGDWFAGSPYANTGGTGAAVPLSVQNIFDFLTNWFNGGCS